MKELCFLNYTWKKEQNGLSGHIKLVWKIKSILRELEKEKNTLSNTNKNSNHFSSEPLVNELWSSEILENWMVIL